MGMSSFKRAQTSEDKRAQPRPGRYQYFIKSVLVELSEPERVELFPAGRIPARGRESSPPLQSFVWDITADSKKYNERAVQKAAAARQRQGLNHKCPDLDKLAKRA